MAVDVNKYSSTTYGDGNPKTEWESAFKTTVGTSSEWSSAWDAKPTPTETQPTQEQPSFYDKYVDTVVEYGKRFVSGGGILGAPISITSPSTEDPMQYISRWLRETFNDPDSWQEREIRNDLANLPSMFSPNEILNFVGEIAKNPREVAQGLKQQMLTAEGWKKSPVTNLLMVLGAYGGAKSVAKWARGKPPVGEAGAAAADPGVVAADVAKSKPVEAAIAPEAELMNAFEKPRPEATTVKPVEAAQVITEQTIKQPVEITASQQISPEAGFVKPELITKPIEMAAKLPGAFYKWVAQMTPEARYKWTQDHIVDWLYKPLPPSLYEKGPLSFDMYRRAEGVRNFLVSQGKTNPAFLREVNMGNPELIRNILIEKNKALGAVKRHIDKTVFEMKDMPEEMRRQWTDLSESRISKQEFVDKWGDMMSEASKSYYDASMKFIKKVGDELEAAGFIDKTSRAKWEDPNYLHRYYQKDQSLGVVKSKIEKQAPGLYEKIDRVYRGNRIAEMNRLSEMTPEQRTVEYGKMNPLLAADLKYIIDNNFEPVAKAASSVMKNANIASSAAARMRGLKIDTDIFKQRGMNKTVSLKNVEKMKGEGWETVGEPFGERYDIQKGGYTKLLKNTSNIKYWTDRGWKIGRTSKDGTIITKGGTIKNIPSSNLETWQSNGWEVVKKSQAGKQKMWRDYTPLERELMGEIREIDFKIADTMMRMSTDLTNIRALGEISKEPYVQRPLETIGKNIDNVKRRIGELEADGKVVPENILNRQLALEAELQKAQTNIDHFSRYGLSYKTVPDTKTYGALRGKAVPENIYSFVVEEIPMWKRVANSTVVSAYYKTWKKSKTVWNPATHVRNTAFNVILADMAGVDPFNPKDIRIYKNVASEFLKDKKAPGSSQLIKEIRNSGVDLFKSGFAEADFNTYMKSAARSLSEDRPAMESMIDAKNKAWNAAKKVDEFAVRAYAGEETFFKAVIYAKQRALGKSPLDAAMHAQRFLFDYSNVAPVVDMMRSVPLVGSPFVTFYSKLVPLMLETAVTNPTKMLKWMFIAKAVDEFAEYRFGIDEEEAAAINRGRAPWNRNAVVGGMELPGKTIKLPFRMGIFDKENELYHYDIGYLNPMGDFRQLGSMFVPFYNDPVLKEIYTQISGIEPFTGKELRDPRPWGRTKHAFSALAPLPSPTYGYQGAKLGRAVEQIVTGETTPEWYGGIRPPEFLLADVFLGQKLNPETVLPALEKEMAHRKSELQKDIHTFNYIAGKTRAGKPTIYYTNKGNLNAAGRELLNVLDWKIQANQKQLEAAAKARETLIKNRTLEANKVNNPNSGAWLR